MDPLSDILDTMHFRGCLYFTTALTGRWGIRVPQYERVVRFHLVSGGTCWVGVDGVEGVQSLEPGDLILIPHGNSHTLSDKPDTRILELDKVLETSGFSGSGSLIYGDGDQESPVRLVCGHFEFDRSFDHPLFAQLPPRILIRASQAIEFSWFSDALRLLSHEAGSAQPGFDAIVKRLSEILFVHMVRYWANSPDGRDGFVAAIGDRHIGRSLTAFHAKHADKWQLEELAREAGLSRTLFAERFKAITGQTPMQYVAHWRMQKAKRLLEDSTASVEQIAGRIGYDSVAAFGRAFKKVNGVGPGSYRRGAKERSAAGAP